jgi:hypothetical protein
MSIAMARARRVAASVRDWLNSQALVVSQPAAVADHHHGVRSQHRQVVGDGLGVGRTDADVDQADAVAGRGAVVPGRHRHSRPVRPLHIGQPLPELLDVHVVVGEQHMPLEPLRGRPGVVGQPVQRQGHPLRTEQEQFLGT